MTLKDGRVEIGGAGVTLELMGNGPAVTGGEVRHAGKNIGATLTPGGAKFGTAEPEAPTGQGSLGRFFLRRIAGSFALKR